MNTSTLTSTIHFATIGKDGKDDSRAVQFVETTHDIESMPVLNFATIGKDGKDDSRALQLNDTESASLEAMTMTF